MYVISFAYHCNKLLAKTWYKHAAPGMMIGWWNTDSQFRKSLELRQTHPETYRRSGCLYLNIFPHSILNILVTILTIVWCDVRWRSAAHVSITESRAASRAQRHAPAYINPYASSFTVFSRKCVKTVYLRRHAAWLLKTCACNLGNTLL